MKYTRDEKDTCLLCALCRSPESATPSTPKTKEKREADLAGVVPSSGEPDRMTPDNSEKQIPATHPRAGIYQSHILCELVPSHCTPTTQNNVNAISHVVYTNRVVRAQKHAGQINIHLGIKNSHPAKNDVNTIHRTTPEFRSGVHERAHGHTETERGLCPAMQCARIQDAHKQTTETYDLLPATHFKVLNSSGGQAHASIIEQ